MLSLLFSSRTSDRLRAGTLPRSRRSAGLLVAAALLVSGGAYFASALQTQARQDTNKTSAIPAAEFARLSREFSEEGGYFFSDNFTSNESAYLHILPKLKQHGATGGAYIGVGPEQNFTYIARVRPQIAFIVDIRRQAVIQHLLYKAVFHHARNPAQFLALLLSRPMDRAGAPQKGASLGDMLEYFVEAPTNDDVFAQNLVRITRTIQDEFRFPLTAEDKRDLEYVYRAFWRGGLGVGFRFPGMPTGGFYGQRFPALGDLIVSTDAAGHPGNFLAIEADYAFVRRLHLQNRIIPVVGDFGGAKALRSIARYLRENGYTLTLYYTSNVEQFLFDGALFQNFAESIRQMPLTHRSMILRAARLGGRIHPAYIPGHRMAPLLERIPVFLKDYDAGVYESYWDLISTHYISADSE